MADLLSRKTLPDFVKSVDNQLNPGILCREPSWLIRTIAKVCSGKLHLDDDAVKMIRELSADSLVVYALKYPTWYNFHYLRMRLAAIGLTAPCFLLGNLDYIQYRVWKAQSPYIRRSGNSRSRASLNTTLSKEIIQDLLRRKATGALFLEDKETSLDLKLDPGHDPISVLLEAQSGLSESIFIVPVFFLYDRVPRRKNHGFREMLLGDPDQPGLAQRIMLALRKWTVPELLVASPVKLNAGLEKLRSSESGKGLPLKIRSDLIENIDKRIRVNRGPDKLSLTDIKQRILQDKFVRLSIREFAVTEQTSEEKARQKAEAIIDEIAADENIQIYHHFYYIFKTILDVVFKRLDYRKSDFSCLKRANEKNSLIFISCHKSHFDYLIHGYVSFVNQMPVPYMAAGRNLMFWPVGQVLRKGGAFYMRRSFKDLPLYKGLFAAYVRVLLRNNININFYVEGGRSRTGKFLQPKIGMLGFMLDEVFKGQAYDLTFIPTYVGYDQIPEAKSYLRELRGHEKCKESFLSFLRSIKILGAKYGTAFLRFHEPVSFRNFLALRGDTRPLAEMTSVERRSLIRDFAFYLMTCINASSVVTTTDLVAASLVCHGASEVKETEFINAMNLLNAGVRHNGIEVSDSLTDLSKGYEQSLESFKSKKFIYFIDESKHGKPRYVFNEAHRMDLIFHKNSLLNCLWAASALATVILSQNGGEPIANKDVFRNFRFLKRLLYKEFVYNPLIDDIALFNLTIEFFAKHGLVRRMISIGCVEVRDDVGLGIFEGLMFDILRVYIACAAALDNMTSETCSERDLMKLSTIAAQDLHLFSPGQECVLPVVTIKNALKGFAHIKAVEFDNKTKNVRCGRVSAAQTLLSNFFPKRLEKFHGVRASRQSAPNRLIVEVQA